MKISTATTTKAQAKVLTAVAQTLEFPFGTRTTKIMGLIYDLRDRCWMMPIIQTFTDVNELPYVFWPVLEIKWRVRVQVILDSLASPSWVQTFYAAGKGESRNQTNVFYLVLDSILSCLKQSSPTNATISPCFIEKKKKRKKKNHCLIVVLNPLDYTEWWLRYSVECLEIKKFQ